MTDELLNRLCISLQITLSQFELAENRYEAVGEWLRAKESKLAKYEIRVYAQGSMRHKTTVRPRPAHGEEFDLDIVIEVIGFTGDPLELFEMMYGRLKLHPDFGKRLTRLKRCVRLSYANAFHLDILPGRRQALSNDGHIDVPDRELEAWHPSNPDGYAKWFDNRCTAIWEYLREEVRKRASSTQQPLPEPNPEDVRVPLRRAVQLLKRRRDNMTGKANCAPRSIILTTLAAQLYTGGSSTLQVLTQILDGIDGLVQSAHAQGNRLVVRNPTRQEEDFSESWNDPEVYRAFLTFIATLREEVAQLRRAEGLDELGKLLDRMFGHEAGSRAVEGYGKDLREAKDAGTVRVQGPAIIVGGSAGRKPAPNTYHHGA